MQDDRRQQALGWAIFLFLAFVWGSSFILMKRAVIHFSPLQVGALRVAFASAALLPFAVQELRAVPSGKWKFIIASGLLGNFIPAFLFAYAATRLDSSLIGALNALTPMFAFLTGILVFGIPVNRLQSVGLTLGLAGAATLSLMKGDGSFGTFNASALLVVAATVCYGTNANILKVHFSDMRPLAVTSLCMFANGPLAFGYLATSDVHTRLQADGGAWLSLFYVALLGVIGTALALVLFTRLIKGTSAVFASSITYLIPAVAICWGVADGERLFWEHYVGMALIVGGVYVVNRAK